MELPMVRTKTGYVRLRFPELRDWSGTVFISGPADGEEGSFNVAVVSDSFFADAAPLACVIETSDDGVDWTSAGEVGDGRSSRAAASPAEGA